MVDEIFERNYITPNLREYNIQTSWNNKFLFSEYNIIHFISGRK